MLEKNPVTVGMKHTIQKRVEVEDTSLNYGSGKIENLLATPRLVALAIEAGSRLVDPLLPEGFVSVGRHIELDHFKATVIGATVTVVAEVDATGADAVYLSISCFDEHGLIAIGKHTRRTVNHAKLLEKASLRDLRPEKED